MRHLALAVVLCAAQPAAQAAVFGVAHHPTGVMVEFHDTPGEVCKGGALRAVFVALDQSRVEGCWKDLGVGHVQVVFVDGDFARVPLAAIVKPKSL